MALIPITGIQSSFRVPGSYLEILFGQGPSSAATGVRTCIVVAPKLAAASATAATVYTIGNEQDIIDVAGLGSPAHRACRIFMKSNKDAKLYYLGMEPTTGGSPVAADGTIVYATTATGTGSTKITICGEEISVGIASGDSVTDIGDNVEAAINEQVHLPCTASNAAGTVTLTAKISGVSQGDGTIPVIRYRAEISTGIGTTVSTSGVALGTGTGTAGVEGSTTEAAQLTTALAGIDNARYYYIGTTTHIAAGLTALETHISSKSEPNPGLRSVGITGFNGTLAASQTLANAINYERMQLALQVNSEHDPAELMGNVMAVRQKREAVDAAYNFNSYNQSDWLIKPVYATSDYPSLSDQNDAINDGITIINSASTGSYIVMSVNTRSKNSAGTINDFRATKTHKVSVGDLLGDRYLVIYGQDFQAKKLKDDQRLSDGTVNPNQKLLNGVVTPSTFSGWIKGEIDTAEAEALLQDAEASKESLRVVIDPLNASRLEVGHDFEVIGHLDQATFRMAETSAG